MDSGDDGAGVVDLLALARNDGLPSPRWTLQSDDLNANLLVFAKGNGVGEHINAEVDVLVVGIEGEGEVVIDGAARVLRARQAILIPKGARRSLTGTSDRFAYLTCHRRRSPLVPRVRRSGTDATYGQVV